MKIHIVNNGIAMITNYVTTNDCAKMIVNAGIRRVVYEQGYPDSFTLEIFSESGVSLEKYEETSDEK